MKESKIFWTKYMLENCKTKSLINFNVDHNIFVQKFWDQDTKIFRRLFHCKVSKQNLLQLDISEKKLECNVLKPGMNYLVHETVINQ